MGMNNLEFLCISLSSLCSATSAVWWMSVALIVWYESFVLFLIRDVVPGFPTNVSGLSNASSMDLDR